MAADPYRAAELRVPRTRVTLRLAWPSDMATYRSARGMVLVVGGAVAGGVLRAVAGLLACLIGAALVVLAVSLERVPDDGRGWRRRLCARLPTWTRLGRWGRGGHWCGRRIERGPHAGKRDWHALEHCFNPRPRIFWRDGWELNCEDHGPAADEARS